MQGAVHQPTHLAAAAAASSRAAAHAAVALAVLEIFHPQPDFNVQALLDASTWFAWFHVIQLVLTGLVALSVLLLAADYGRANAWTTRLGIGAFLVFFGAYDTLAGIGTGLAMHSARDLSGRTARGRLRRGQGLARRSDRSSRSASSGLSGGSSPSAPSPWQLAA